MSNGIRAALDNPAKTAFAAAAAIAVGLHIQLTFSPFGTPVRFSLADVVAPLILPLILRLLARQADWRRPPPVSLLAAVLGASAVMTYGFAIGAANLGEIQTWAVVKYVGWFVLLFYAGLGFLLGVWQWRQAAQGFMWAFVSLHAALLLLYLPLASIGFGWFGEAAPRMAGLLSNPNAYGFALLCGLSLLLAAGETFRERLGRLGWEALVALFCAGVLFSRSVGALGGLALAVAIIVVAADRRDRLSFFRAAVMAGLVYALPATIQAGLERWWPDALVRLHLAGIEQKLASPDKFGSSLAARIESSRHAVDSWLDAPLFGNGLGTFIASDPGTDATEGAAMQIHNTALWILNEFGLVGLTVFTAMFVGLFLFLYRAMCVLRKQDPPRARVLLAGVMVISVWVAMSMVHELMYQRIPWFMLGLCAGVAIAPMAGAASQAKCGD